MPYTFRWNDMLRTRLNNKIVFWNKHDTLERHIFQVKKFTQTPKLVRSGYCPFRSNNTLRTNLRTIACFRMYLTPLNGKDSNSRIFTNT